MYFRKAVDDATSEWAQHHAKRFVDTAAKGLRGAIPPNFPYLNVEFGLGAGFVHVVDDEERFDASLARGVLIGGRGVGWFGRLCGRMGWRGGCRAVPGSARVDWCGALMV